MREAASWQNISAQNAAPNPLTDTGSVARRSRPKNDPRKSFGIRRATLKLPFSSPTTSSSPSYVTWSSFPLRRRHSRARASKARNPFYGEE